MYMLFTDLYKTNISTNKQKGNQTGQISSLSLSRFRNIIEKSYIKSSQLPGVRIEMR